MYSADYYRGIECGCMDGDVVKKDGIKERIELDERCVKRLYEQHVDGLYRLCYYYTKNEQDARDAMQNTMVHLLERRRPFDSEEHAKFWIMRVGANECRKILRQWWRQRIDLDGIQMGEISDAEKADEGNTAQLLTQLPRKYRLPIYMYYYEGYSTAEIARILGLTEAAIRVHMHRGRKMLEKLIVMEGEGK